MAGRSNARPRFQRKPKDWLWIPQIGSFAQSTTALFVGLVLPVDWATGGGTTSKDRATYYGTKGTISIGPAASSTIYLAIGKDISSTFDPSVSGDYVDEGDVFWSSIVRIPATPAAIPVQIPVDIRARRVIQTAGEDAVELVTISSAATGANIAYSLHSLVNRA